MANVISSNTIYIDSTGSVTTYKIKVTHIILTATSANAVVLLSDSTSTEKKIDLRTATSGQSLHIPLDSTSMIFEGGLTVTTLTNAVVTLVYNRV